MTSSVRQRTLASIAFAALLAMQCFGAVLYFCECTGATFVTASEHCEARHDACLPAGHRHHDDHHHDVPAETPGSHHHHERVDLPLDVLAPPAVAVPAPVLVALPLPAAFDAGVARADARVTASAPQPASNGPPLPAVTIARSVVFLI